MEEDQRLTQLPLLPLAPRLLLKLELPGYGTNVLVNIDEMQATQVNVRSKGWDEEIWVVSIDVERR